MLYSTTLNQVLRDLSPFVNNENILNVIGLAEYYHCRPSCFIADAGEYEKYCLDEACAFISMKVKDGEKPKFKKVKVNNKRYKSFSEYYAEFN